MKPLSGLACVLAFTAPPGHGEVGAFENAPPAVVAEVIGQQIRCQDLASTTPEACADALLHRALELVAQDYIERRRLRATEDEIRTLEAYNESFLLHDREQRAGKLNDLEHRLLDAQLAAPEKQRMQEFRDVLARLAQFDADVDAGHASREQPPRALLAAIIEEFKLNIALFARYGGVLGQAAHGPYPHGARMALVAAYVATGRIRFQDDAVRARFEQALRAPPRILFRGANPDFTPFWERPLTPSYMAK
jgi:hypothetical protein